jgi:membrane associated rhomboid family serine protease
MDTQLDQYNSKYPSGMSPGLIQKRPVTLIILGIIVLIFFLNMEKETGIEPIDYGLRGFYHANLQHLIANGFSFLALSFMEDVLGWKRFLFLIFFIWIVSTIILYGIHAVFPSRKVKTVGFSGVIFGLIVVYYSLMGESKYVNMIGLVASIIPQLFMIGISFEGHISGIIAGLIYIFTIGKTNFLA